MISLDTSNGRFNFRSVAVIIQDDHVLIHRATTDDFWALPGGRVEFFETSAEAVVREIQEEINLQSKVDRQLWHVENFFEFDGKKFHEIANYFLVSLTNQLNVDTEMDFKGIETSVDLLFRWVPLSLLNKYDLRPAFLIEKLNDLPGAIQIMSVNDLNET